MKVIHVTYSYPPDPSGGTEVYVEGLANHLRAGGIESVIAAPGSSSANYDHRGLRVHRFETNEESTDVTQLYELVDPGAATGFGSILDAESPDIVHQHALSRAASPMLTTEAHRRGIPVVFSYHTPTVTCQRGTLLRWGADQCDGKLRTRTCAACTLHSLGSPKPLAMATAALPQYLSSLATRHLGEGRKRTALGMRDLTRRHHAAIGELLHGVDQIVVMAKWTEQVLLANNVPPDKITLSEHGVSWDVAASRPPRKSNSGARLVWMGRIDPVKGLHVLIEAIRSGNFKNLTLDVYGIVEDRDDEYVKGVIRSIEADGKFTLLPPVPPAEVASVLVGYDVVVVPSLWLETGPLIVLEAFAAGIPVIATDLPAISEHVEHGRNGILVNGLDPPTWRNTLKEVAENPGVLHDLASGVRPPRSISDNVKTTLFPYTKEL